MQVHLEREDQPQAKPLEEIKAHLNIVDHLLMVEGLDLHPAGDPVDDSSGRETQSLVGIKFSFNLSGT